MGGILVIHKHPDVSKMKSEALRMSRRIRHRGPDWTGVYSYRNTILVNELLSIVGRAPAIQPLANKEANIFLIANAEIYNHAAIRRSFGKGVFQTDSDCEAILHLYRRHGRNFVHYLDGIFSFILYDQCANRILVGRDPLGITSLYFGRTSKNAATLYFSSEMKALDGICDSIVPFPSGSIFDSERNSFERVFRPAWRELFVPSQIIDLSVLKKLLVNVVKKQMMSDVPWGVFLSGEFASSLIASIAADEYSQLLNGSTTRAVKDDHEISIGCRNIYRKNKRIVTFSVGLEGSKDLEAASKVANLLKTTHYSFVFTPFEAIDAVRDVIYHLESFDVSSVRAALPPYIMARKAKALGFKMVLCGYGCDQAIGSDGYARNASSSRAGHKETIKRIDEVHSLKCSRVHKSTMAWGVEARFPHLDVQYLNYVLSVQLEQKFMLGGTTEKSILRQAFETGEYGGCSLSLSHHAPRLPEEQINSNEFYLHKILRDHSEEIISSEKLMDIPDRWTGRKPDTKEGYWYRMLFDEQFNKACDGDVDTRQIDILDG